MEKSKKYSMDEKQDFVEEPAAVYGVEKLKQILPKEDSIGFDVDGNSISEKEFTDDIHEALNSLAQGKLETYSSQAVRRKILG